MAEQDDVEAQFQRLVAGLGGEEQHQLPKASRASLREVKREARARAKRSRTRSHPAKVPRGPRHVGERARTVAILVVVVALVGGAAFFQWRKGSALFPGQSTAAADHPTAGHEEASAPLGTPPTVADAPGRYAFVGVQKGTTTPVAYDPCRPIHYVVNTAHMPAQGRALLTAAVSTLSAATGLHFVDDGTTEEKAGFDREPYQPDRYGDRWAPVLVAWPTGPEQPDFVGSTIGEAGSIYSSAGTGPRIYLTGVVQLDSDWFRQTLAHSGGSARAESVVLHELGHLVGLAHVTDDAQIMFAQETPAVTAYAAGDLAGLARLGAGACEPGL